MIDLFRTWLPQMISYAELIHEGTAQRAWATGERAQTSVYYSGELYEQVFGDLESDRMLEEGRAALSAHPQLVEALEHFLTCLKRLDAWIEARVDTLEWGKGQTIPTGVAEIFAAGEWDEAQSAGRALVAVAAEAGYSSKGFITVR